MCNYKKKSHFDLTCPHFGLAFLDFDIHKFLNDKFDHQLMRPFLSLTVVVYDGLGGPDAEAAGPALWAIFGSGWGWKLVRPHSFPLG
jgi:hypothetical protein